MALTVNVDAVPWARYLQRLHFKHPKHYFIHV